MYFRGMSNLHARFLPAIAALSFACLISCGKKEPAEPPTSTPVNDSTATGGTGYVRFRVDGLHDLAVDTAPHTNVMALEIVPDTADTSEYSISVDQLPTGVTCAVSKSSGRAPFKTSLHFAYDYTGRVGRYPASVVVRKGDSTTRLPFSIVVPDTVSKGWVFAGRKSSLLQAEHIYDPPNFLHLLYARTSQLLTDPVDTVFRFHFSPQFWPFPSRDTTLVISVSTAGPNVGGFTFEVRRRGVPYPNDVSTFRHPSDRRSAVRYYYNAGKPRLKATGLVVESDPSDSMSRRILSFDISVK